MKLKTLTSLLFLGGLLGCSTFQPGTTVASVPSVSNQPDASMAKAVRPLRPTSSMADTLYVLARRAHDQGRLQMASQRYEQVLSLQPDHAGALNALAVLRVHDGRTDEAIDLLTKARELDPESGHIHNNLGVALLRAQRLEEAEISLRLARELQPLSEQVLLNLSRLEQTKTEQLAADPLTSQAVAQNAMPAPAAEPLTVAASSEIVSVAPQVYELRLSATLGERTPAQDSELTLAQVPAIDNTRPLSSDQKGIRLAMSRDMVSFTQSLTAKADGAAKLEISNGAGVEQLARRTAKRLAQEGLVSARLTNAKHYRFPMTQIEYLSGQEAAVQAVADRLPVPVKVLKVSKLDRHMSLRLTLGQDSAGRSIAAWLDTPETKIAGAITPARSAI